MSPLSTRPGATALGSASSGFTLVELAVVLVVVTLLLGSLLVPLGTQVDQRNISSTRRTQEVIQEALLGFAASYGRLPCPDTDGDGLENEASSPGADGCSGGNYVGFLPWATLGVASSDAWGNRFKYRVTNQFTRKTGDPNAAGCAPGCTLELGDGANLYVKSRNPTSKALQDLVDPTRGVPAVVISFGKNGFGATTQEGFARQAPPTENDDEETNLAAATTTFIGRSISEARSGCSDTAAGPPLCELDDLVIWVPPTVLFNRMVTAGQLP